MRKRLVICFSILLTFLYSYSLTEQVAASTTIEYTILNENSSSDQKKNSQNTEKRNEPTSDSKQLPRTNERISYSIQVFGLLLCLTVPYLMFKEE